MWNSRFWTSGQYASLAAVPNAPGWSLQLETYYYAGKATIGRTFRSGDTVTVGTSTWTPQLVAQPTYTPETKIWGGLLSLGIGFGYGKDTTGVDAATSRGRTLPARSDGGTSRS